MSVSLFTTSPSISEEADVKEACSSTMASLLQSRTSTKGWHVRYKINPTRDVFRVKASKVVTYLLRHETNFDVLPRSFSQEGFEDENWVRVSDLLAALEREFQLVEGIGFGDEELGSGKSEGVPKKSKLDFLITFLELSNAEKIRYELRGSGGEVQVRAKRGKINPENVNHLGDTKANDTEGNSELPLKGSRKSSLSKGKKGQKGALGKMGKGFSQKGRKGGLEEIPQQLPGIEDEGSEGHCADGESTSLNTNSCKSRNSPSTKNTRLSCSTGTKI